MRRDSFVFGAFVLVLGSLISRVLGATYRLIVPQFMGDQAAVGMGLYGMAAPIYGVLLSISATGLPVAVARMVAARISLGRQSEAQRVFRLALVSVAVIAATCAIGLFLVAPWYATHISRDPRATLAVQAVAPAVFVVAVAAVFRGFLQGLRRMTPYAVSQVVEQLARVSSIVVLVIVLLPAGIAWAAAGVSVGATVGGVGTLLYLLWQVGRARRALAATHPAAEAVPAAAEPADSTEQVSSGPAQADAPSAGGAGMFRELMGLAVPISLATMVLPLVTFIDALLVPSRLNVAGFGDQATAMYGWLTGFANPFMVMPTTFTAALALNLVPTVSERQAQGDKTGTAFSIVLAIRLALIVALPAAAGLAALATPIESLVFGTPQAGPLLFILAFGVLAIGLQQVTAAALQGLGKPVLPMMSLVVGGLLKFVLTYVLVANPAINISGAAISTVVAFLVAAALNLVYLQRLGQAVPIVSAGWRPALAAAVMGVGVWAVHRWVGPVVAASLGGGFVGAAGALVLAIVLGVLAYGFLVIRTGAVTPEDVRELPRVGPRMVAWGRRLHLWPLEKSA